MVIAGFALVGALLTFAGNQVAAGASDLRIVLRHIEGRSYEEIATTLDLPLGTVKTYIHRARNELRLSLAHLKE